MRLVQLLVSSSSASSSAAAAASSAAAAAAAVDTQAGRRCALLQGAKLAPLAAAVSVGLVLEYAVPHPEGLTDQASLV
jgi:hypothetical protein